VIEKLTAQIKELQESNSKPTIETVPISSSPSTDHTPQRDHDDQIATKSAASTLSESTVAAYELRIQQLEAELALRDERIRELTCIPPSIPPATSAGDSSEQKIEALEAVVSDREETIRQLHSELSSQRERVEELEQNQERLLAVASATTATTSVTTGGASTSDLVALSVEGLEKDQKIQQLSSDLAALQEVSESAQLIPQLKAELETHEASILKLSQQLEAQTRATHVLEEEVQSRDAMISELHEERASSQMMRATLMTEVPPFERASSIDGVMSLEKEESVSEVIEASGPSSGDGLNQNVKHMLRWRRGLAFVSVIAIFLSIKSEVRDGRCYKLFLTSE
jgi:predicted RNase H-like nuclease (RuvC/YqgF family)